MLITQHTDKLDHEHVPEFEGVIPADRAGRVTSPAGELVRFANADTYRFAAYWDCHPGGPCRGNHYHCDKTEVMYLISGELRAAYYDLDTRERLDLVLVAGDLVTVRPRLVHSYVALRPSQVVEVATHEYSPGDTYKHVLL
ncbi:MAG: Cupin domain protein [Glaciihabitans sp.]|nr:Cupin domain protein [Glaciihabitans sp.]